MKVIIRLRFFGLSIALLYLGSIAVTDASAQGKNIQEISNYNKRGTASFYGTRFNGQRTSSGEAFDSHNMTAASNSVPLNTYVKVTNLRNGRWVIVRVNDRMARHNKRLIDLSRTAAKKLRMIKSGLAQVSVEALSEEFLSFFSVYAIPHL